MAQKLDELFVEFSEKGAGNVLKSIDQIEARLVKFSRDMTQRNFVFFETFARGFEGVSRRARLGLNAVLKANKDNSDKILEYYDKEIKKLDDLRKARANAYDDLEVPEGGSWASNRIVGRSRGSSITNLAVAISAIAKLPDVFRKSVESDRQRALQREAAQALSGISAKRSTSYDTWLGRYGGEFGEGMSSLQGFSARLGAATRGDVSLLRSLGRWGITGISPHSSSEDAIKAITQGAKGKSVNEINAMGAELGLSQATVRGILAQAVPNFGKDSGIVVASENMRSQEETFYEAEQEKLTVIANKYVENVGILTQGIDKLIKKFPELAVAIEKATNVILGGGIARIIAKKVAPNFVNAVESPVVNTASRGLGFASRQSSRGLGFLSNRPMARTFATGLAYEAGAELTDRFYEWGTGESFGDRLGRMYRMEDIKQNISDALRDRNFTATAKGAQVGFPYKTGDNEYGYIYANPSEINDAYNQVQSGKKTVIIQNVNINAQDITEAFENLNGVVENALSQ